jgi:hypothetical protein
MVKYTLEQQIFLYNSYAKRNPINHVKESFSINILVFKFQLIKVDSAGSFLDKKYTRQNAVLDCRLVVLMGRDFVSALQPVASCTIPG